MLYLNLKPIFSARGIEKPSQFLIKNGFNSVAAHRLLSSQTRAIKFDHIEKICEILLCEPNDLFQWIPNSGKINLPNNPLNKLIATKENPTNLKETLTTLPYQQLKEITAKMTTAINENQ
jgi:DNA-binding Xre family transcriptional regulator